MRRIRPTYANVTATLALFVSLSGGAYAAATLPANSVGPRQLKKNAVVGAKIKKNAVDGTKVRDGSVSGDDIKESSLEKVPLAAGADHAAALDRVVYKTAGSTAPVNGGNSATAACDAGQHVVGGGAKVEDPINALVVDSYPDAANTAWTARAGNFGPAPVNFTVFAICTTVTVAG
jgi:hypothetical protein